MGGIKIKKKIISLSLVSVFIISTFSAVGTYMDLKSTSFDDVNSIESFIISISFPDFEIVENNGTHSIEISGSFLNMDYRNENVDCISAHDNYSLTLPLLGFGRGRITVSFENIEVTKQLFALGPFVFILQKIKFEVQNDEKRKHNEMVDVKCNTIICIE